MGVVIPRVRYDSGVGEDGVRIVLLAYRYTGGSRGYIVDASDSGTELAGLPSVTEGKAPFSKRTVRVLARFKNERAVGRMQKTLEDMEKNDPARVFRMAEEFWAFCSAYMEQREIDKIVLKRAVLRYDTNFNRKAVGRR